MGYFLTGSGPENFRLRNVNRPPSLGFPGGSQISPLPYCLHGNWVVENEDHGQGVLIPVFQMIIIDVHRDCVPYNSKIGGSSLDLDSDQLTGRAATVINYLNLCVDPEV
jgi:hypothetical protein